MSTTTSATTTVKSPFTLDALAALLLRPGEFFTNVSALTKRPETYVIAWISGIAYAIARVEANLMKGELGSNSAGWQALEPWLAESWFHYWFFVLAFGVINGWILWYLGGWWYRKRLEWCGETNSSVNHVRATYVYQDLVHSGPSIFVTLVQTLVHPTYSDAAQADEYWSMLAVIFLFWSCVTSYKAASTYAVVPWKARMWFLLLPIALYVAAIGAIGAMYALLQ